MSQAKSIRADTLVAFDVHVHIEHEGEDSGTDQATKKYFGDSGAGRSPEALAEYYRSRNMACVVFSVDESVTGRPVVSNDRVMEGNMLTEDEQWAKLRLVVETACRVWS